MVPLPTFAVTVPGHVPPTLAGLATTTLPGAVGSVSVNTDCSWLTDELALPRKIVRVDVPLGGITAGANCLLTVGGVDIIIFALVGSSLLTPSRVVILPAAMVLV